MNRILAALLVTSVAACATEEEPVGYGEGFGTPENPIPHEGSYAVASRINLTAEMPQIEATVANLRAFSLNPAHTLLTQVQQAGSPAVQELYSALSTTLKDQLEGWINAEIDNARIAGKTLRQYAGDMATITETSLSQFKLESSLTITPTHVLHSLTALNFTPANLDIIVPIGGLAADSLTQRPTAVVGEGGALTISDQHFGLAFGNHAWQGINLASTTLFGGDLPTTLVKSLNCGVLAQTVSTKCISTSCVGHATQLAVICETGVSEIVDDLRERFPSFNLDELRFIQGSARLVDDTGNGVADRIMDGTWDTEVSLVGLQKPPATFTATR